MFFRDLGTLRVEVDDLEVAMPGRRLASVLGRLIASVGEPVSVDALVDATWGEDPPARATQALETVVWRLRSALEPGRAARAAATIVRKQDDGYVLAVPTETVDSRRFTILGEQSSQALGAGRPEDALALSEAALSLWRGEPYASLGDASWLAPVRQRLAEQRLNVAACHVQALLETDQPERALNIVSPLVLENPFHERFWVQRMLGLYRAGRQADALAAFGEAQRILSAELGVDPGPELRTVHAQVLNQAPELDLPAVASWPSEERTARLPSRRKVLIGRESTLADIVERIQSHRLVTVTGQGGVGKTRIAVEAGHRLRNSYPHGVWFVDLSDVRPDDGDSARLREIVASTLGFAPRADIPVDRALTEHLRDRHLLLIIDNCEQVLGGVCALVEEVLDSAGRVCVLATSRESLEIDGESVVQLPTLAAKDATALFVDRLANLRPDLDPDGKDRVEIARICEAVGSLPLGIELAAARARVFELDEVAASLADGAVGLARPGHGPQRHASMLDAVDWSYRLARPDEQILHRRLATLPGPVTLEAVSILCTPAPLTPDQAPDLLAGLVHRSLLISARPERSSGRTSFRQLVPTRVHAARLLEPDERRLVTSATNRWLVDWVRDAALDGRPGQAEASAWIHANGTAVSATLTAILVDSPHPAALLVLTKLTLYWFERGQLLDAARWYRAAVAAADVGAFTGQVALIARVLDRCTRALSQDRTAAQRLAADVPQLAHPPAELAPLVAEVLVLVAVSTWVAQVADAGLAASRAAMAIGERLGQHHIQIRARALSDMHRLGSGEELAAIADAQQLLADTDDNQFAAFVASYLGVLVAARDGDAESALRSARQVAQAHRRAAMHPTSELLEDLGCVFSLVGSGSEAVRILAAAQAMHDRDSLPWPRLQRSAAVMEALKEKLAPADYDRLWRSGLRLGRSVSSVELLDEWFPDSSLTGSSADAAPTA